MPSRRLAVQAPYAFEETTRLLRTGGNDPTFRRLDDGFISAHRFPTGSASLCVRRDGDGLLAEAWGPGADEALDRVPRRLGLHEAPWRLPAHPKVDGWLKAQPGLRLTDTQDAYEALINIVPQQLVTWAEAAAGWRKLVEGLGEPAPGPHGLWVPPDPRVLKRAGTPVLQSFGIGAKRARVLIDVASRAHRLQEAVAMPTPEAQRRLQALPGIGPWTASSVLGMRLGRPEPIIEGDYHLPNTVVYAFTGEPRGTEAQMLELLAPFEGHAMRVLRLIHGARIKAPARGPKREAFARHR